LHVLIWHPTSEQIQMDAGNLDDAFVYEFDSVSQNSLERFDQADEDDHCYVQVENWNDLKTFAFNMLANCDK
jgi:hypothetical protein